MWFPSILLKLNNDNVVKYQKRPYFGGQWWRSAYIYTTWVCWLSKGWDKNYKMEKYVKTCEVFMKYVLSYPQLDHNTSDLPSSTFIFSLLIDELTSCHCVSRMIYLMYDVFIQYHIDTVLLRVKFMLELWRKILE